MNTYVEAYRNVNFQAMLPLITGTAREEIESALRFLNGKIPDEVANGMVNYLPEGISEEIVNDGMAMYQEIIRGPETRAAMQELFGRTVIVSSGYVGDEFHFKLRTPMPEMPELPGMSELPGLLEFELPELPEIPENIDKIHKMRKQNGDWLIYE